MGDCWPNVDRLPVRALDLEVDPVVFSDPVMRMKQGWVGRLPVAAPR
ncbi:MAG: hypothetical protein CM1200mP29_16480 [Verrucomicrobiota bacterium]|nr:MAG: hypothetical protein CM1200mP29_16480 [Verrucomicrobiota bacterium]